MSTVATDRRGKAWTAEEVDFLLVNRDRLTLAQLSSALRRDEAGILIRLKVEMDSLKAHGNQHRKQMTKFSRTLLERLHSYMLRRSKGLAN